MPTCDRGNDLISELAYWLEQFSKNKIFKGISIKLFIVLQSLHQQPVKPNTTLTTKPND